MKRICLLLCIVMVFQMLCSCGARNEEILVPVNFYYGNREITYNSPSGVIQAEIIEGADFHDNITALLTRYLQGPASSELQSLVPAGTTLISCEIAGNTVNIEFSEQFSQLSGIKLTTASSAILMTMHDCFGVQTLCIYTSGTLLDDKKEFILSMDDIVLADMTVIEE